MEADTLRRADASSAAQLPPSSADPGDTGQAALEDSAGQRVSAETSRRLACDAAVVVMRYAADGTVLDVGRRTRTIPPAIRRALTARDKQCRFPGCSARRCDAHHIEHWADGGATRLENLAYLCRRHHRLVHEGGWRVERREDGEITFVRPNRRVLPDVPDSPDSKAWPADPAPLAPTMAHLTTAGIAIDARTTKPCADGARFDVGWALDVLRHWPTCPRHV